MSLHMGCRCEESIERFMNDDRNQVKPIQWISPTNTCFLVKLPLTLRKSLRSFL
jgi:hypothetical protein